MGFNKLDSGIIFSSLWGESSDVRLVFITMLAMCDQHGNVMASIPGLARAACVPIEVVEEAIGKFMSPDKYSRSKVNDGQRIAEIPGGWNVLNHGVYRAKSYSDSPDANRMREKRANIAEQKRTCSDLAEHAVYVSVSDSVFDSVSDSDKDVNTNKDDTHNLIRVTDWKESKAEYDRIVKEAAERVKADTVFCSEMERLHQNIDCDASIDAALIYWLNDAVYERLRRKRTQNIRPESWFRINFAKNKIYRQRKSQYGPQVVTDEAIRKQHEYLESLL